jgi:hypothetical protein
VPPFSTSRFCSREPKNKSWQCGGGHWDLRYGGITISLFFLRYFGIFLEKFRYYDIGNLAVHGICNFGLKNCGNWQNLLAVLRYWITPSMWSVSEKFRREISSYFFTVRVNKFAYSGKWAFNKVSISSPELMWNSPKQDILMYIKSVSYCLYEKRAAIDAIGGHISVKWHNIFHIYPTWPGWTFFSDFGF